MNMLNVYILNMPRRQERRTSSEREFGKKKSLFNTTFVCPVKNEKPCVSHWLTFLKLVGNAMQDGLPCFVFCEDDHVFTSDFDEPLFIDTVRKADALGADILLGGVSWMDAPIQITDHLFWLNRFNGTQFVIVFSRFYGKILDSQYDARNVVTDFHISSHSDNIFVAYPFFSIQKEFGYSDVTSFNNKDGYVDGLFKGTSAGLSILDKVRTFYHG